MKKKILVVTDASFLNSGYGVYAKEILSRFHDSSSYEVAELGCYATVQNPLIKNVPWRFYPNAVESDDPRYKVYSSNNLNQFGAWRFNRVCAHFKPDIVLTWTDYWMYSYQEVSPFRNYFYWIQMPMVDSAPQKTDWLYTYSNADCIVPYTAWAGKILSEQCKSSINLYSKPANAGIDPHQFYLIDNKKELKESILGFDADIVGCVMRNQKRKLFYDTMLSFSNYLKILLENNNIEKYNKTYLYLHTSYPEPNGWDLPSILIEHNILDKVYFSYICRSCEHCFPSKFKDSITLCPKCKQRSAFFPNVTYGYKTKDLNVVYNLFDILLQNAIAEGFGIPQLEAASCGVPFASVDYGAMSEIAENLQGFKIPVQKYFRELETNANRVYPDNNYTTDLLYKFFNEMSIEDKQNISKKTRDLCTQKYTWDNVYSVWKQCCDEICASGNKKLSWEKDRNLTTNHENMKVPPNLNPREFVEYICKHILCDTNFAKTSLAKSLIRDLHSGLTAQSSLLQTFDYAKATQILESHLSNKITCQEILNTIDNTNEDFLICHK